MKKKILITIDSLTSGGAEKSLISLLTLFDYDKYDVDLLLFYQRGLYLPLIPKEVNVIEPPGFLKRINKGMKSNLVQGDLKALYLRMGLSISCRNPLMTKKYHGAQIIYKWLSKGIENLDKEYDVAIAYSQGMPTYYVSQKVKAKRKLAWMNIDYKVAGYNKDFDIKYYNKFDKVVAVSHSCKDVLIKEIPSLENKVEIIYDIISSKLIENMANEKGGFSDEFDGIKILTIGRLVHQKGYEMAIEAAYKLKQDKINFKWYAIGEGKLKEKFYKNACEEYLKRLQSFCKIKVIEIDEANVPEKASQNEIIAAVNLEGKRILSKIPDRSHIISMCIEGKQLDSIELSEYITKQCLTGTSSIVFILGGSWGLSDDVKKASNYKLSMSKMTFPHQLARVMLCEQIYRTFQIANDGKYHK